MDPGRPDALTIPVAPAIELDATLDGGQAFRWWPERGRYRGVIGSRAYLLSEGPASEDGRPARRSGGGPSSRSGAGAVNAVVVEAVDGAPVTARDLDKVRHYLGLDYDFAGFASRFGPDPCIGPALTGWPGLRVLRQDRWECLVAFICSSTSSIPRIKRDVNGLAMAFGERVGPGPRDFTFPGPGRLAGAGEAALRRLGLGFRAKYVARAAEAVARGGFDLEAIVRLPYRAALDALTGLEGVGEKVADCVLAFSFDMPEAFPVDRWVKRALVQWYGVPAALSTRKTADWARARFGRDAAYVNQYLFHRQRLAARMRSAIADPSFVPAGSAGAARRMPAPRPST